MKYVVIGAGPSAQSAVKILEENEKGSSITLLSNESTPFYFKPTLVDYISGSLSEKEMIQKDRLTSGGISVLTGKRVVKIDTEKNIVVVSTGEKYEYNYLIIASGAVSHIPENLDYYGCPVFTLSTLADAMRIRKAAENAKRAVVTGKGYVGIEIVRGLRKAGLDVTYVVAEEDFWPDSFMGVDKKDVVDKLENEKVKIMLNDCVLDVFEMDQKRKIVATKRGNELECDMAVSAFGMKPNISFLQKGSVKTDRGVLVTEELRSSVSNVFAAGDVAQVYDVNRKINRNNFGWDSARIQGEICARNILGEGTTFISDDDKFFKKVIGKKLLERW